MGATWTRVEPSGADGEAARIAVAGEVSAGRDVVVDLAGVTFMDSSGVRVLVRLWRHHGECVRLGPVSPELRRALRIAGVVELFHVSDPVAESA